MSRSGADADAVEAHQLDQLSKQLLSMQRNYQETIMNTELFKSRCPRICVPLSSTVDAQAVGNGSWAETCLAASAERKNDLLAVALLAAARRLDVHSVETQNFRNAYRWWYGASADDGHAVQMEVLKALNKDGAQILNRQQHLPRVHAYIEEGKRLWMFFIDGRVNFGNLLCSSTGEMLCRVPEQASSVVANVAQKCNDFTSDKTTLTDLILNQTVNDFTSSNVYLQNVESHVAALRKFEPSSKEDFHNALAETLDSSFVHVRCAADVKIEDMLQWPAPQFRERNIVESLRKLRTARVRPRLADIVLQQYEQHENRLRDARASHNSDLIENAHDADSSIEEELVREQVDQERAELLGRRERGVQARSSLLEDLQRENGSINMTIEYNDEDMRDFFDDLNDNPRMRININNQVRSANDLGRQVSAQNRDERGAVRSFDSNFADVFGQVSNELEALSGGGLGALDRNSDVAKKRRERESADNELRNILSMSATGAAMRAKFEKQNVFREFRRINGKKLCDLRHTHQKGTLRYEEEMKNFRSKALKEATDAFFGRSTEGHRVSVPIREARAWLASSNEEQIPAMPTYSKNLSPFGNFILHLMNDLDQAFTPGAAMEDMILCVMTATAGFWHHDGLRPNILLHGAASVGKSYTLRCAASLMPDGVSFSVTHETDKAGLVDGMNTDLLETVEEMPQHKLGADEYGNEREASSTQKDRLTNIYRTTVTLECTKDPETGELVRKQRVFHSCEEMARQYASNAVLPCSQNALLNRWIVRFVTPSTDPTQRIINKMHTREVNFDSDDKKQVRSDWQKFFIIQLYIEKMIEARAIQDVNMDAMIEMKELLAYVSHTYRFHTDDPKMYDKIHGVARLFTLSYAIYSAVTSDDGLRFRFKDVDCTQPRTLSEAAVEIAEAVEKHLVCTREVVVYVFSLMRSEWMPTLRQDILQSIRTMCKIDSLNQNPVADEEKENESSSSSSDNSTKSGRKRHREGMKTAINKIGKFGPASNSNLGERGFDDLCIDSSYMYISDNNGSTKERDVANEIRKHITNREVTTETIMREMKEMSNVDMSAPIYVHLRDQVAIRSDILPVKMTRKNTDGSKMEIHQTKPLFFCGRLPNRRTNHTGYRRIHNGATSNTFQHNSDDANLAMNIKQQEDDKFQEDHGSNDPFACMILFHAIINPADHRGIVQSAVQKLAHKNMQTERQTLVISQPHIVEVKYPDVLGPLVKLGIKEKFNIDSKQIGQVSKLTLFSVPSTVTIEKDYCVVRTVANERPVLEYQVRMRRMFRRGARAERERRRPRTQGADAPYKVLATDPDHEALIDHHEEIGQPHDATVYWLFKQMLLQRKREVDCDDYIELEDMIKDKVASWEADRIRSFISGVRLTSPAIADKIEAILFMAVTHTEDNVNNNNNANMLPPPSVDEQTAQLEEEEKIVRKVNHMESMRIVLDQAHPNGNKKPRLEENGVGGTQNQALPMITESTRDGFEDEEEEMPTLSNALRLQQQQQQQNAANNNLRVSNFLNGSSSSLDSATSSLFLKKNSASSFLTRLSEMKTDLQKLHDEVSTSPPEENAPLAKDDEDKRERENLRRLALELNPKEKKPTEVRMSSGAPFQIPNVTARHRQQEQPDDNFEDVY